MTIQTFADLLQLAHQQALPQRLLCTFVRVELPEDASEQQRADFAAGQGGALVPCMCVDKGADELPSFDALVREAQQFGQDWRFVFVGALSTPHGGETDAGEVDRALQAMVESIKRGEVSRFLAFDPQGIPAQLQ